MLRRSWILGLVFLASCGVDIESGAQQAGQRCFVPSDCSDGLTCFERICVPGASYDPVATNNNLNNNNQPDSGLDIGLDADMPSCAIGTRRCLSDTLAEICVAERDIPTIVQVECSEQEICRDGQCIATAECIDADQDGYGAGCERGPDCNDRNERINPGAAERCQSPADDNCNGVANEGCNPDGCCANGCSDSEFCNTDCVCQDFEPQRCTSQNQPCSDVDSFANGYYCVSLGNSDQPRCYGVCSTTAADPDSTCPDPNSICALGDDGATSAICVSNCDFEQGCGDPSLGCLPYAVGQAEGGVCLPANPNNPIGADCDPDEFLDCADGAICVARQNGNGGGVCREACRPFAFQDASGGSDCSFGHCFPYSSEIGVCIGDNNSTAGEQCQPQFTMCQEDAVACLPTRNGVSRCQNLCRLAESDCDSGLDCIAFDASQQELGICTQPE